MKIKVNPTRMELLKLKKRLILARRGHSLLKDKQDELMKKFFEISDELKKDIFSLEKKAKRVFVVYNWLKGWEMEDFKKKDIKKSEIDVKQSFLYNIKIPEIISLKLNTEIDRNLNSFYFLLKKEIDELVKNIIDIGVKEKILKLVAKELASTRRRVNALEYILIPELKEAIRYINIKLEEMERGNLMRLMRVKEIVRKK